LDCGAVSAFAPLFLFVSESISQSGANALTAPQSKKFVGPSNQDTAVEKDIHGRALRTHSPAITA
jgi:hypothetical protein